MTPQTNRRCPACQPLVASSAMTDDRHERKTSFLDILRGESEKGPGQGLGRFARLLGGGAGLARRMLQAGRQGADAELRDRAAIDCCGDGSW